MEVASGHRRRGLGTQAIELLRRQHPGRTVFARPPESEDASLIGPVQGPDSSYIMRQRSKALWVFTVRSPGA